MTESRLRPTPSERAAEAFLRAVPMLEGLPDDALEHLARSAVECTFEPGHRVLEEGELDPRSRWFHVIRSGSADVLRRTQPAGERVVARLSVGCYFGELGLLTGNARIASVRARGNRPLCTYAFDGASFDAAIARNVLPFRLIRDRRFGDTASSAPGSEHVGAPTGCPTLAALRRHATMHAVSAAEQRWHDAGATIVYEQDPGDRFFLVLDGAVDIIRSGRRVARLGAGDFFGETSLLFGQPRNASVVASEPTLTWSITRREFERMVAPSLLADTGIRSRILQRLQDAP